MVGRVAGAGVLVALALAAGGCGGGSKSPGVANIGTSTSPSTVPGSEAAPSSAALARCFTDHGFPASVGSAGSSGGRTLEIAGVAINGNVDPSSPQFQAAMQACRKYLPGGGPPPETPAEQAAARRAMTAFAACMRKHGVPNFPDPNSEGIFPIAGIQAIDPSSPVVGTAFKACESLEPTRGPRIEFGRSAARASGP